MVVDLAVADEREPTVLAPERLRTRLEVDDAEAPHAQCEIAVEDLTAIVGATVGDRAQHGVQHVRGELRCGPLIEPAGYTAHARSLARRDDAGEPRRRAPTQRIRPVCPIARDRSTLSNGRSTDAAQRRRTVAVYTECRRRQLSATSGSPPSLTTGVRRRSTITSRQRFCHRHGVALDDVACGPVGEHRSDVADVDGDDRQPARECFAHSQRRPLVVRRQRECVAGNHVLRDLAAVCVRPGSPPRRRGPGRATGRPPARRSGDASRRDAGRRETALSTPEASIPSARRAALRSPGLNTSWLTPNGMTWTRRGASTAAISSLITTISSAQRATARPMRPSRPCIAPPMPPSTSEPWKVTTNGARVCARPTSPQWP